MKARHRGANAPWNLNHLERGLIYRATTLGGATTGEYLGIEAPHGDWAILLRHGTGARSIDVNDLTSIRPAA